MRRSLLFMVFTIVILLACGKARPPFAPGPLGAACLNSAAASLGYTVAGLESDIPVAVRPPYPFRYFGYRDSLLNEIRTRYDLEQVVAAGRNEWEKQCLLKHWVHGRITNGTPTLPGEDAIQVLDNAAAGAKYWCSYYALTYMQCAQALGWTARKLGIDRLHGLESGGSSHHGVDEVWSNQWRKWVVIDCQSDLHYEKDGVPLSAWEIRAGWLKNQGADIQRVVGYPEKRELKNPAIVWWDRKDEDETACYFWIYYADNALRWEEDPPIHWIFPQDSANAGYTWYQGGAGPKGHPHTGYQKKMFIPTTAPEAYGWTVGVVEARADSVADGVLALSLDSYTPNFAGFEANLDDAGWKKMEGKTVSWPLKAGANSLGLRTLNVAGVTGPEVSLRLELGK